MGGVADLVDDEQTRLGDLAHPELGGALHGGGLEQAHEVVHPLEADGVVTVAVDVIDSVGDSAGSPTYSPTGSYEWAMDSQPLASSPQFLRFQTLSLVHVTVSCISS